MEMDECMIHADLESGKTHELKEGLEIVKVPFRKGYFGFYVRPGLRGIFLFPNACHDSGNTSICKTSHQCY